MGIKVSLFKLKSTDMGVKGESGESNKNGDGLLRTRKGERGLLYRICDEDNLKDCFRSSFFSKLCCCCF